MTEACVNAISKRQFFTEKRQVVPHVCLWAILALIAASATFVAAYTPSDGGIFGIAVLTWQAWTAFAIFFAAVLGLCIFLTAKGVKYGPYMLIAFIAFSVAAGLLGAIGIMPFNAEGVFWDKRDVISILLLVWDMALILYAMILFGTGHPKWAIALLAATALFILLTIVSFLFADGGYHTTEYSLFVTDDGQNLVLYSYDRKIEEIFMSDSFITCRSIGKTDAGLSLTAELFERAVEYFDGGFKITLNGAEQIFYYLK